MAKLMVGNNDLASVNPKLAAEWHPSKNEDLTPQDITAFSSKKVWWLGKCGHEWQATVTDRSKGTGCPFCTGNRLLAGFNDLASQNPNLAEEWHPTKNDGLTPQEVFGSSKKIIWWLGKCGHEWQSRVSNRFRGVGCPFCTGKRVLVGFNDLATKNPSLAAEWHPTKNDNLTPQDVTPYSTANVWWLGKCGHEWQASVHYRSNGTRCPYCTKRGRPRKIIEYK